ncbi:MAG: cytochrome C [Meiothermus sp.]
MYRNDTVVPAFAIIFAIALFYMAYLVTQRVAALSGHTPAELTVGQIGLMAFGAVLFMYGFIGLLSNWLEGTELRPGKHEPEASSVPVVAGVILSLALAAASGLFVRTLVLAANKEAEFPPPTWLQGGLFAAMMLIIALLIAIYKKFFMTEEVLAEDEKGEFPW